MVENWGNFYRAQVGKETKEIGLHEGGGIIKIPRTFFNSFPISLKIVYNNLKRLLSFP